MKGNIEEMNTHLDKMDVAYDELQDRIAELEERHDIKHGDI